jgi:hypothetical protein
MLLVIIAGLVTFLLGLLDPVKGASPLTSIYKMLTCSVCFRTRVLKQIIVSLLHACSGLEFLYFYTILEVCPSQFQFLIHSSHFRLLQMRLSSDMGICAGSLRL